MGAFILFPVLMFSIFTTAVIGFTDYVHVAMLVHAAAQNAAQAAAEIPSPGGNGGTYQGGTAPVGGVGSVAIDSAGANNVVGNMLNGQPYILNGKRVITSYSCTTTGIEVTCVVHFKVYVPILGYVNATTSASASNAATGG